MAAAEVQQPTVQYGGVGEAFPHLFDLRAMPTPKAERKPGQLPDEVIRQFFEDGYVIVKDFFDLGLLEDCRKAVELLVEDLAQKLYAKGKIKELYKNYGLFERLTMIEKDFPGANIILHKYGRLPDAFKRLWTNESLLNVVEQLIGPNIAGHPVWNLRTKTPQNEATTVPWHQDVAYLDNKSYQVLQPTAWIPLLNATERNGCMQVAHQGHRSGKIATHQCCHGGTWYVMLEEDEMAKALDVDLQKDIKTCEIPYGGMLLLNNMIPHRSLANLSNEIRWSLDLRWQNPSLPYGFYDMKQGVVFRKEGEPNLEVDWDGFEGIDRHEKQRENVQDMLEVSDDPDFDTTIQGPWMKKWEIVHVNQHTAKLDDKVYSSWHAHKA